MPAVVDLAAMRDAMVDARRRPEQDQPAVAGRSGDRPLGAWSTISAPRDAFEQNVELEYRAQQRALRVPALGPEGVRQFPRRAAGHRHLPPGQSRIPGAGGVDRPTKTASTIAYPDTLVGTDSHTTMVNGLGVLGWGVGGIEAEAAMLGQPISMLIPEVVGFKLTGKLREGATATDLVLTVTQMLRKKGVVGKFVEFFGPGLDRAGARRPRDDRQHGAGIRRDLRLLPDRRRDARAICALTGRDPARVALVEAYAKAQGMWRDAPHARPGVHRHARARPRHGRAVARRAEAAAGPGRRCPTSRRASTPNCRGSAGRRAEPRACQVAGANYELGDGDVVIAAITSCTNTSNPSVMLARRARRHEGGRARAEGQALGQDLARAGLAGGHRLSRDGRAAGAISTRSASTSSAMAAPPASAIPGRCPSRSREAIDEGDLVGRRRALGQPQFRGPRPSAGARQLPRLAAAGGRLCAGRHDAASTSSTSRSASASDGKPVYLNDIWPTNQEIARHDRKRGRRRDVPQALRRRVQGRRELARDQDRRRA